MSTTTSSPSRRNRGGSRKTPTPPGVPVAMTSPGSRVMNREQKAMRLGTSWTISDVLASWMTSPLTRQRMRSAPGIRQLVGGHDPRSDRAERVEALAAHPLAVAELQVACRDVIETGIPEDVIERLRRRDVARRPADHDGQLRLVVDLTGVGVPPHDVGSVADEAVRELGEDDRIGRRGLALLGGVLVVVPAHGDDLARVRDRRQEIDVRQGMRRHRTTRGDRPPDRCQRAIDVVQQPRHRPRAVVEQIVHVDDGVVPGHDGEPFAVRRRPGQQPHRLITWRPGRRRRRTGPTRGRTAIRPRPGTARPPRRPPGAPGPRSTGAS